MTNFFSIAWLLVQTAVGFYLVFPTLLYGVYLLRQKKGKALAVPAQQSDYAIIVTAYEQTSGLQAVVKSLLQLAYDNYLIYIVADKCDVTNLHFADDRVIVLRPPEALNSNTRSHFYAIRHFTRPHERLTIIDSDNLVEPDYLQQLDHYFAQGYEAVQGIRNPKNLDTTLACLDAARDIYYHFYDGKVLFGAGSSATLAGSGMAFTTRLYRDCLEHLEVTGAGFDKVLQAAILNKNLRIAYTDAAVVYDEKTTQSEQLVNQRARWINTWFRYFKLGFGILGKGIARFSLNQFLFGLMLLRPPLFIFLIVSFGMMVFDGFFFPVQAVIWLAAFGVFVAGFVLALQQSDTPKKVFQSLKSIPRFVGYQIISLLHSTKANQRSVATRHYHHTEVKEAG